MINPNKRPVAVFQFRKYRGILLFIAKLRNLILNISANSSIFTTPAPTILAVTADVDALEAAEEQAQTRAQGKVAVRNQKYGVVVDDVYEWLAYVQMLVIAAPDYASGLVIIEASGFSVKEHGVIVKPPLEVVNAVASGSVDLIARGGPQGSIHEWQMSTNGLNWTNLPSTSKARTQVTGLTKLSTVYFRHRLKIKDVPQEWSQPVNIVVL